MHTEIGFDLKYVKHYKTPQMAQQMVENTLAGLIAQGVVFNINIVQQMHNGELRHIPLLNCWRVPQNMPGELTIMGAVARKGFVCFR